jgi:hypothetical protein
MSADRRVYDWSLTHLLHCGVAISGAKTVLAEEDSFRDAMVEANSGVLPVADVVSEAYIEDDIPKVEAVKEEPEGVDDTMAFVNNDQHRRRSTTAALGVILWLESPPPPPQISPDGRICRFLLWHALFDCG